MLSFPQPLKRTAFIALFGVVSGCATKPSSGEPHTEGSTNHHESSTDQIHMGFGGDKTLEVVTWNIEEFPKNGQSTAEAVVDILQGLDADIVALQEISDVALFEQMVRQMPGWEGYVDSEWYAGLAYLYRTDVIEPKRNYEIYTTEEFWRAFPRSPQVMEFRFGTQDFVVINNHFKCCGDGFLDRDDPWDEETRRMDATNLLKEYIDTHFAQRRVIVLGDLNDSLTDRTQNNVFSSVLSDPENYKFADMGIAEGDNTGWSFPSYPSHLDHILISGELFAGLEHEDSNVVSLPVDEIFFDGWRDYERTVSDHRPVALKTWVAE